MIGIKIPGTMVRTTTPITRISAGFSHEVRQLLNHHDASVDAENYLCVIYCKTAKLFEAAMRLSAIISKEDKASDLAQREADAACVVLSRLPEAQYKKLLMEL